MPVTCLTKYRIIVLVSDICDGELDSTFSYRTVVTPGHHLRDINGAVIEGVSHGPSENESAVIEWRGCSYWAFKTCLLDPLVDELGNGDALQVDEGGEAYYELTLTTPTGPKVWTTQLSNNVVGITTIGDDGCLYVEALAPSGQIYQDPPLVDRDSNCITGITLNGTQVVVTQQNCGSQTGELRDLPANWIAQLAALPEDVAAVSAVVVGNDNKTYKGDPTFDLCAGVTGLDPLPGTVGVAFQMVLGEDGKCYKAAPSAGLLKAQFDQLAQLPGNVTPLREMVLGDDGFLYQQPAGAGGSGGGPSFVLIDDPETPPAVVDTDGVIWYQWYDEVTDRHLIPFWQHSREVFHAAECGTSTGGGGGDGECRWTISRGTATHERGGFLFKAWTGFRSQSIASENETVGAWSYKEGFQVVDPVTGLRTHINENNPTSIDVRDISAGFISPPSDGSLQSAEGNATQNYFWGGTIRVDATETSMALRDMSGFSDASGFQYRCGVGALLDPNLAWLDGFETTQANGSANVPFTIDLDDGQGAACGKLWIDDGEGNLVESYLIQVRWFGHNRFVQGSWQLRYALSGAAVFVNIPAADQLRNVVRTPDRIVDLTGGAVPTLGPTETILGNNCGQAY